MPPKTPTNTKFEVPWLIWDTAILMPEKRLYLFAGNDHRKRIGNAELTNVTAHLHPYRAGYGWSTVQFTELRMTGSNFAAVTTIMVGDHPQLEIPSGVAHWMRPFTFPAPIVVPERQNYCVTIDPVKDLKNEIRVRVALSLIVVRGG